MAAQSASSAELVTSLRFASDPGANFVDPLLQFRKVRPRPVYLFAASTAAELVVIDCGERLEFADYVGLGCRFQRGVTSQAPSERCDQFRKVKTADNLDRLFVGVLGTRAIAVLTIACISRRRSRVRSARFSRAITSSSCRSLAFWRRRHQIQADEDCASVLPDVHQQQTL